MIPEAFADCADAACREAWVSGHLAADARGVGAALATVTDPVEQVLLVRKVHEQDRTALGSVCRELEGQAVLEDCVRLRDRAHLSVEAPLRDGAKREVQARQGMILDQVRMHPLPTDRLQGVAVDLCEGDELPVRCQANAAVEAAQAGDAEGAWGRCLAIETGTGRDECAFRAAENLVLDEEGRHPGPERVAPAMELCMASASFQAQCLTHVIEAIGGWAPQQPWDTQAAWDRLEAGRVAGAELLDTLDPTLGPAWSERLYAEAAWQSVARLQPLEVLPLVGLPEGARAHMRGAAAMALLMDRTEGDINELSARLEALESTPPRAGQRSDTLPGPPRMDPQLDLWGQDDPSEASFPSVPFAGRVRRTRHEDPALDRLIVLMEAASQVAPPKVDIVAAGLSHEDERVRWTSVRLLRCVGRHFDGLAFVEDESPAVRFRAAEECDAKGQGQMPGDGDPGAAEGRPPQGGHRGRGPGAGRRGQGGGGARGVSP